MKIRTLLKLLRNVESKSFKKGEVIIGKGSTRIEFYFIRKGMARCYSEAQNANDENITFQLFAENHTFGNVSTVVLDEPSKFIFEALEDMKTYSIDYEMINQLSSNDEDIFDFNRKLLGKNTFKRAFNRLETFVFLNPEERYLKYVKDNPTLVKRAPDKYIAHVLGITPTSLSRIRKRISTKKV